MKANRYPVVLIMMIFALACGDSDGSSTADVEPLQVAILGDSITAMEGYVELIQDEISTRDVWRSGRPGYTTRHWIPGWGFYEGHDFETVRPRIVVLLLGSNDASVHFRISVEEYMANLATIVDALNEDGAGKVILMTAPKAFSRWHRPFVAERLLQYANAVTWYCQPPDDNIECGPDLYGMLEEADFEDGLHPNAEGHELIANALLPYLIDHPEVENAIDPPATR
jgi:hypothetical protein